jgi:acyl-CoA synthetase (AMP-forming)/AMP-acid ligase II
LNTSTIIESLRFHALKFPDKIVFTEILSENFEESRISFEQLENKSNNLAKYFLQKYNSKLVVILLPQGIDFIITFFAILKAGKIAIPCSIPKRENGINRFLSIIENSGAKDIILKTTDKNRLFNRFSNLNSTNLNWVNFEDLKLDYEDQDIALPKVQPDDIAFLQFTSGSTSLPKGVIISHKNIQHNSSLINDRLGTGQNSVSVCWLPNFHDLGLIDGIIQPVFAGFSSYILSPIQFTKKPAIWLQAMSRYKATYACSPNFGLEYTSNKVKYDEIKDCNFANLKFILVCAEPVRASTIQGFVDKFHDLGFSLNKILTAYGLAECTLYVSSTDVSTVPQIEYVDESALKTGKFIQKINGRAIVTSGNLKPESGLIIVDQEKNVVCEENQIGEICIATQSVSSGYWNNGKVQKNNLVFGKYLKTGDLGVIFKDNLFITGRIKELIILNGKNYYPHDIEQTIVGLDGNFIQDSISVVSFDDTHNERVVAIIEISRHNSAKVDFEILAEKILKKVFEIHELAIYDVLFISQGAIHKTTSGKIQRFKNLEAYLNNDFKILFKLKKV